MDGYEVMNSWEHPLMKRHADLACRNGGDILEIGFGMGISANYIQSNNISSHTIVEIHPQILKYLREWSKDIPNVRIIEGDWFDKIDEICQIKYLFQKKNILHAAFNICISLSCFYISHVSL